MLGARRRLSAVVLIAAGLLATTSTAPASAAPAATVRPAAVADFYRAPSPLPSGRPGQLVRFRTAQLSLPGAPATTAWTVMYHSRDAEGRDLAVTGTVLRPTAAWTGGGPRPFVTFTVGTQGLGPQCAPSKQLAAGTEYEASTISMALDRGWGVVVTDYDGYATGSTPSYTVGPDMAHAALDIVRAARQVPGSQLAAGSPLAAWGYSQGSGAAGWTTSLQPAYAPELHLRAAAAGGVPADPKAVGESLNGNVGAGFLLEALVGNEVTYRRQWPFTPMLNAAGVAAVRTVKGQCVSDALTTFAFKDLDTYLLPGYSLATFDVRPGPAGVLAANQLADQPAPQVPIYQYHSLGDEIVPRAQATALHQRWCAEGVQTRFDVYPGDHLSGDSAGAPAAVQWIADVFAGRPVLTSCVL
ncbi:MAG: lipase family protein [Blastococcus sp.]